LLKKLNWVDKLIEHYEDIIYCKECSSKGKRK